VCFIGLVKKSHQNHLAALVNEHILKINEGRRGLF
jgi:hypothetical protein